MQHFTLSQTVVEHAGHHASWLITSAHGELLHCEDRLLHLWGPPGAGKTVCLLLQARKWLAEGKAVIIAVGGLHLSMLLQWLGNAALSGQEASAFHRMKLCRHAWEFEEAVEQLGGVSPTEVCVIVDEVERDGVFPTALDALCSDRISYLWSASVTDLTDTESSRLFSLGGRRTCLPQSLRCPPHVMEQASTLVEGNHLTPAMAGSPYLPACLPTPFVKVILHPSHSSHKDASRISPPHYHTRLQSSLPFDCRECSQWLKSSLPPLMEGFPPKAEQWRHWVILGTGSIGVDRDVTKKLENWLQKEGVPAVLEEDTDLLLSNLPVSTLLRESESKRPKGKDEETSRRERLVSGLDTQQRPAVHIIPASQYSGLEKPGVLVFHWDWDDEHPHHQNPSDRRSRLSRHCDQLFCAVTRCQADICICLLSPSPAARLLALSQADVEAAERRVFEVAADAPTMTQKREKEEEQGRKSEEELKRLWEEQRSLQKKLEEQSKQLREQEEDFQNRSAFGAVSVAAAAAAFAALAAFAAGLRWW